MFLVVQFDKDYMSIAYGRVDVVGDDAYDGSKYAVPPLG